VGEPTGWLWDFGDNTTSTEQHPVHTYTTAGTYNVSLTAGNDGGSDTLSRLLYVTAVNVMPISIGDIGAAKGQTTQASLIIHNASSVAGGGLDLTYDPAVVTVDAVNFASPWEGASNINNTNGKIRLGYYARSAAHCPSGDVLICTVTLRAVGEPGDFSPLNITVDYLSGDFDKDRTFAARPIPGAFEVLYPDTSDPIRYIDTGGLYKGIRSGNTLYIGEEGLNLTRLGSVEQLVHYSNFSAGAVDAVISVPDYRSFDLVPAVNPIPGRYYARGDDGLLNGRPWVEIQRPHIGLDILLSGTNTSAHGASLTRDAVIDFALENNLESLHATPPAIFIDILVTTPDGGVVMQFGGRDLRGIPINTSATYIRGIPLNSTEPGIYTAQAVWPSISDFAGKGYDSNTVSFEIILNTTPPVVNFTANTTAGPAPLTVRFTDTSTGNPTAWLWSFGDGATSTERNATHTYTAAGTYTVNLTVENAAGSDSVVKANYITVTAAPVAPAANFTANVTTGNAPLTVRFTDTSTGSPTAWSWSFGDSNTSTEQNPTHTYTVPGIYNVSLTATNSAGSNTTTRAGYITVVPAPEYGILWSVPLSVTSGTFSQMLTLGSAESATRGFDAELDVPTPPEPPGAKKSAYFTCTGPTFRELVTDYRPPIDTTNPEESWTLAIRSDEPVQVTWDATLLTGSDLFLTWDDGASTIAMKAMNGTTLPAGNYSVTITAGTTRQMNFSLQAGWNLVSTPFSNATYTVPPDSIVVIYGYNTSSEGYETVPRIESLVPGRAYWIAAGRNCTVTMIGAPVNPITAELKSGWNLIGSTADQNTFENITITPAGSWAASFVYGYDPQVENYVQITELRPGEGYWGAVIRDCTITLP